ncbi:hypothetical protein [Caballeronia sp. RCC_10]|uniref:hypothetical protein n=1 Tax=Caballeronia sp. RCC_10 TaxID=3239227 RepID=UPI003523A576
MSKPAYFEVNPLVRKVEPPYYPAEIMCPGSPWNVSTHMVVVAPPDYPQLAEGLEIGALYEVVRNPGGTTSGHFFLDNYYFEGCEKLAALITGGERLAEHPSRMVDWSIQLSELVVDETKYPESEGRGPFWELLRYGLRGMTFGPAVCRKLVADFEKWYIDAWALGDLSFTTGMFSCKTASKLRTVPVWSFIRRRGGTRREISGNRSSGKRPLS